MVRTIIALTLQSGLYKCVIDASGPQAYAIRTPPGSIYTVDDGDSTADCMLVENGEILAVGNAGMRFFSCYTLSNQLI
jgi:hypothetical protein